MEDHGFQGGKRLQCDGAKDSYDHAQPHLTEMDNTLYVSQPETRAICGRKEAFSRVQPLPPATILS